MSTGTRLEGEVAIVTAGGQGIGEAIAKTFAREGAQVAVADIDKTEAERVAGDITAAGGKAFALVVDGTKSAEVDAMVADVAKRCGTVDILLNGVGGWSRIKPIAEITDEEWQRSITLNLTSAFYATRAAARIMIAKQKGRIISLTSGAGVAPSASAPSYVPYGAAKAGMIGMTRLLARDLGEHNITVNCVSPGTSATPRVVKARDAESLKRIAETNPMRKLIEPQDAAEAALFLASKDARYITGVTLLVNAGKIII